MSRVDRDSKFEDEQRKNEQRRDAIDRTPNKAEGDEETVDQALENSQDETRS